MATPAAATADRFYVTTPIYYINDVPHLGTAYTTIVADALARYHRARGRAVHLLTGTDEHGEKVEEAARKARLEPKAHADRIVPRFRDHAWPKLDVAFDDFIRTTDERHERVVADLWRRMHAAGDLYLGEYEGFYCVGCEAYYADGEVADGKCPVHARALDRRKQPSYFFRLSKYEKPLLEHYRAHPEFVRPQSRLNEVRAFVEGGLRDLSVSRVSFKWGIPVPDDPAHVIYVWIDALSNYVSALGGPGAATYERFWPADVHLIGKDIVRFHAVYWPAMLMSAGLPLPRCVFAHGWWSVTGRKISKSLPATRIDPVALAGDVGVDALRYFLLREIPLGMDGDFSYEGLIGRTNADLANDLGNLVNRTLAMVEQLSSGTVPEAGPGDDGPDTLRELAESVRERAAEAWEDFAPSRALEATWELVRAANVRIAVEKPWEMARDPARRGSLCTLLYTLLEAVRFSAELVAPAMPRAAVAIRTQLGLPESVAARWPRWGDLAAGLRVARGGAIFPRIDKEREAALLEKWTAPVEAKKVQERGDGTIDHADFAKLDLRVAVVIEAAPVEGTDRLLKLVVDIGAEKRQVVAGIAKRYAPADLIGRRVVLVANLRPARIRGERSEGMILAAGEKDVAGLVTLDCDAPPGTKVR